jgi:hypothetical protein
MGLPFIHDYATDYLGGAFDLSRVFLYKWTVNWRFIPEELFLDRKFAFALVIGHLTCLLLFLFFRWSKPQEVPAFVKHALSSRGLWQGVGAVTKDGKFRDALVVSWSDCWPPQKSQLFFSPPIS